MGNSACCSQVQDEKKQELNVILEDNMKSSQGRQILDSSKNQQLMDVDKSQFLIGSSIEKQKGVLKNDDPSTPGFFEVKSEATFQSNKKIIIVTQIELKLDGSLLQQQYEVDERLISLSLTRKKSQDDSPRCEFKPKNTLKSIDAKKVVQLSKAGKNKHEDNNGDSLQISSDENLIQKQEKKCSNFRQNQIQGGLVSHKKVHFQQSK